VYFLGVFPRKNPAVDVGARGLRERVWRMATEKAWWQRTWCAEANCNRATPRAVALRQDPAVAGHGFHVRCNLPRRQRRVPFEKAPRNFIDFCREGKRLQPGQRAS